MSAANFKEKTGSESETIKTDHQELLLTIHSQAGFSTVKATFSK